MLMAFSSPQAGTGGLDAAMAPKIKSNGRKRRIGTNLFPGKYQGARR
jgi:hypothetical protein